MFVLWHASGEQEPTPIGSLIHFWTWLCTELT
jgi:hypothetical protein